MYWNPLFSSVSGREKYCFIAGAGKGGIQDGTWAHTPPWCVPTETVFENTSGKGSIFNSNEIKLFLITNTTSCKYKESNRTNTDYERQKNISSNSFLHVNFKNLSSHSFSAIISISKFLYIHLHILYFLLNLLSPISLPNFWIYICFSIIKHVSFAIFVFIKWDLWESIPVLQVFQQSKNNLIPLNFFWLKISLHRSKNNTAPTVHIPGSWG